MEFYVYSRQAIERVEPHEVPHVVVSITSSLHDQARIPRNEHTLDVLRLTFPDADRPTELFPEESLFSLAHAEAIWDLLARHEGVAQRVIVHCDAGYSRSPGVAAALSKALHDDDEDFFRRYHPNRRVYRLVLEAWQARCERAGLRR